jgi:hypothetical protein
MKNVKTIIILLIVTILGYVVFTQLGGDKSSLSEKALSDFAVKDTSSIERINLSDTEGNAMAFIKRDQVWTLETGECVQQHMIATFLETFKYIAVKSPVPEGAVDNMNEQIMLHHKKIEIFQNGEMSKTWYVGNPTQDHLGTYMLLKDPEKGKSPEPFIMFLPNMHGNLLDRFSTNHLDYVCSDIFIYDPLNINTIDVVIPDSSELNYKIVALDNNTFELFNNDLKVVNFDTARVRSYITAYRKVHFVYHNRTADQNHIDSLKNSTPYYIISVTDKQGDVNKVTAHLKSPGFNRFDFNGDLMEYDQDNLWVFTRYNELTVCQYHVFDKLLRDINYFKLAK